MTGKVPEEICAECGKTISLKAIAHIHNDAVVCSTCKRSIDARQAKAVAKASRLATPGQLNFLEKLGFSCEGDVTFDKASEVLDRAQSVRYYTFQVARQSLNLDLVGCDLQLVLKVAFAVPEMLEEILRTMEWCEEEKFRRQHEYQEKHNDFISLVECAPDLPQTATFLTIGATLLELRKAGKLVS